MQVTNIRSKYKNNVRCTYCGVWIPKTMVEYNKAGLPVCPECHRNVRTKARRKNNHSRTIMPTTPEPKTPELDPLDQL